MRKLLLIGIMAMFTITTACGVETISEAENEQDTEETSKEQANDNSVVQEETSRRGTISLKGIMQAIMGKFRVGKNDLESARGTINELARGQKGDETKSVSDTRREGVEVSD